MKRTVYSMLERLHRLLQSGLSSVPRSSLWFLALRVAGIVLLIAGLQTWAFDRSIAPQETLARENLELLLQEMIDHRQIDTTLDALRNYSQVVDDDIRKNQIVETRNSVLKGFRGDARGSVTRFAKTAGGFEAKTAAEQESLDALRRELSRLQDIYADHYASAVDTFTSPAWYFQPVVSLGIKLPDAKHALRFNHALYLMLVGDHDAANTILQELGKSSTSKPFLSRVFYTQARLQYDVFQLAHDPEYFRGSTQYARQSVIEDADYTPAKLFLEFLLGVDQHMIEVPAPPEHGQGPGEGKGKRGAISPNDREF